MLERIAKDPQAFIRQQGWASVSLDPEHGLMELRSLYEHLQARILEMIETLDELRASAEFEIFREVKKDEQAIERTVAAHRGGAAGGAGAGDRRIECGGGASGGRSAGAGGRGAVLERR